ncbi:Serine protease inhibitor, potato inhibitor I-type family protein [Prunus dulcis]|uniref:Serine protease inhibitor, potato inhibitor I-type family protein n=1 Tax=Prunus dulcis TaxID=3755 RepID=A0A5H2Y6V4_PRUDU|nr:Serine protease inhibitor, potato inhibitor I-type family protein [Prunus dulcis]
MLKVFNTTLKFVAFLCFMNLIAVNSNPTAAPMKQPNSDFAANDHYFLAKDSGLVPPAGPDPCIPRVGKECPLQAGKRSWPELVGETGEAAAVKIERENPNVRAIILVEGTPSPTKDLNCDKVRVWIDQNGVVTRVPKSIIYGQMSSDEKDGENPPQVQIK